jgi:2-oxoisovalerate dehydrogenase E1 component
VVREFETMLNMIKTTGQYEGIEYNHPGPAHLGIGQEAAYVGQAFELGIEDFIFGSHRSHGEILAKGMSAIEKLSGEDLLSIMKTFFDGETFAVVEKHTKYQKVKDMAREFLLYGMIAETWGRQTGFNRGLGGSMHAFFTPFGVYPNNAIVGGSGPIAAGAALFKRVNRKPGMVVCNIGDGSLGCGPVFEAMNFSSMDQFSTLWDDDHKGGLPIIFNIWNNSYGMGGQTNGETMGYREVARLAAGVNPDAMHAERIDGYNPLAVIDAYRRKRKIIEERRGPVLLDVVTYRISGHSPSDSSSYRSKDEIALWEDADSIKAYGAQLIEADIATEGELKELELTVRADLVWAVKLGKDETISPRIDLDKNPGAIADMMFTNLELPNLDPSRKPDVLAEKADNPRVQKLAVKSRSAYDENGKPVYMIGINQDVTDRKRAEEALQASEEKYRTLVETSPDGVTYTDMSARIIYANEKTAELHGYDHDELIGVNVFSRLVAEAAHGGDVARVVGVFLDLVAQAADVHGDLVALPFVVVAPG